MTANFKIAWDYRHCLKEGETTDKDGFFPAKFSYADGQVEQIDVKGPAQGLSHGFRPIGQHGYAKVYVYITRDGSLRIIAEADDVHNQ